MQNSRNTIGNEGKINVGFVMHIMQVAGAEILVTQMIEQLSSQINPTIFCLDAIGTLGEKLMNQGVPVVVLERRPGLDLKVAKRLSDAAKEQRIQILHAHQYTPFFYSALSRILYRNPSKILFTEHGRHYPDIVSTKRRLVNRWILQKQADITTACCDFSTKALQKIEGFPRATTLRNGVDLRAIHEKGNSKEIAAIRERLCLQQDVPYAACIARFHPVKDHPTLIRAWQLVNKNCPKAKLILVGDGETRSDCEYLADQLGISNSIEFWGIRHDVPDILRAVDVFTLTSVSEAASLTLLEAMASGCPSVLTDVGGNAEHARHKEEAFLAPRGHFEDIAAHLIALLRDSELAAEMGSKARHRVMKEFDLESVINEYSDHFHTLAGAQSKR